MGLLHRSTGFSSVGPRHSSFSGLGLLDSCLRSDTGDAPRQVPGPYPHFRRSNHRVWNSLQLCVLTRSVRVLQPLTVGLSRCGTVFLVLVAVVLHWTIDRFVIAAILSIDAVCYQPASARRADSHPNADLSRPSSSAFSARAYRTEQVCSGSLRPPIRLLRPGPTEQVCSGAPLFNVHHHASI